MAYAGQPGMPNNGLSVLHSDDDEESFSRELKDMLKDGAKVRDIDVDGDLSVQGDIGTGMACVGGGSSAGMSGSQAYRPNSLPSGIAGGYMMSHAVPPGKLYDIYTMGLLAKNNNNKFILWRQFNVKGTAAYIQFIRYVFNSFAKTSSDRALLWTALGKPFQTCGAAAAKERLLKDMFILTTSSI